MADRNLSDAAVTAVSTDARVGFAHAATIAAAAAALAAEGYRAHELRTIGREGFETQSCSGCALDPETSWANKPNGQEYKPPASESPAKHVASSP